MNKLLLLLVFIASPVFATELPYSSVNKDGSLTLVIPEVTFRDRQLAATVTFKVDGTYAFNTIIPAKFITTAATPDFNPSTGVLHLPAFTFISWRYYGQVILNPDGRWYAFIDFAACGFSPINPACLL